MTDYAKLKAALLSQGARYEGFVENFITCEEFSVSAEKWLVNGFGLIVLTDNKTEGVGIYAFIGKSGAPVEQDIAFIEKIAKAENPICGLIETEI